MGNGLNSDATQDQDAAQNFENGFKGQSLFQKIKNAAGYGNNAATPTASPMARAIDLKLKSFGNQQGDD